MKRIFLPLGLFVLIVAAGLLFALPLINVSANGLAQSADCINIYDL